MFADLNVLIEYKMLRSPVNAVFMGLYFVVCLQSGAFIDIKKHIYSELFPLCSGHIKCKTFYDWRKRYER